MDNVTGFVREQQRKRLLSMADLKVEKGIPYSPSYIYRLIKRGQFVQPIRLSNHRIAFYEHKIDAWIDERAALNGEAA